MTNKKTTGKWEPVDDSQWRTGEIIWQSRMPGGECLLLQIYESKEEYMKDRGLVQALHDACFWTDNDFPVLRVLHPTEGMIEDPSYYYHTMREALEHAQFLEHTGYTL